MKKLIIAVAVTAVAAFAVYRFIKNVRVFEEDTNEDEEAAGPDSEPGSAGPADPGSRVRPTMGLDVLKRVDEMLKKEN